MKHRDESVEPERSKTLEAMNAIALEHRVLPSSRPSLSSSPASTISEANEDAVGSGVPAANGAAGSCYTNPAHKVTRRSNACTFAMSLFRSPIDFTRRSWSLWPGPVFRSRL